LERKNQLSLLFCEKKVSGHVVENTYLNIKGGNKQYLPVENVFSPEGLFSKPEIKNIYMGPNRDYKSRTAPFAIAASRTGALCCNSRTPRASFPRRFALISCRNLCSKEAY
jgi:hypothetical protein